MSDLIGKPVSSDPNHEAELERLQTRVAQLHVALMSAIATLERGDQLRPALTGSSPNPIAAAARDVLSDTKPAGRFLDANRHSGAEPHWQQVSDDAVGTEFVFLYPESQVARLTAENFALAAGQCTHPGGIVAGDGGDAVCPLRAEVERLRSFARMIREQKPEKPDHWSRCSQCESNANMADDFLNPENSEKA